MEPTVTVTTKIKREKMRIVKNIFFLLGILFFNACYAQQSITGTFVQKDHAASGEGVYYGFDDSLFTVTTYKHLGRKEIARGSYRIKTDTLYLNYKPQIDPAPSKYVFVKRKKFPVPLGMDSTSVDSTTISVKLRVFNKEGKPMQGVSLGLRNKNKETIMAFISDSLGKFPPLSIDDSYIHDFTFVFMGFKPVTINTDTLSGYTSKIKVVLSKSSTYYSDFDGIKSYLIRKKKEDRIILESLEDHKKIVLERED